MASEFDQPATTKALLPVECGVSPLGGNGNEPAVSNRTTTVNRGTAYLRRRARGPNSAGASGGIYRYSPEFCPLFAGASKDIDRIASARDGDERDCPRCSYACVAGRSVHTAKGEYGGFRVSTRCPRAPPALVSR